MNGARTGGDSSGNPASTHAWQRARSRWSEESERYVALRTVTGPRVRPMPLPLEAVPNFSEGRDAAVVKAIGRALAERAELLDVHTDPDHNRSVFTLVAGDREIVDALLAGIACARERIDLRGHAGVHPRIGAADVVPIVPVRPGDAERARAAALELARRVGSELGLPVFLYADVGEGRGPAFFRRGGTDELQRRIDAREPVPDFGPKRPDPAAGRVIVGARRPPIAFNGHLRG